VAVHPTARPSQESAQERANSTDKTSKQAVPTGNGPTYVSRDMKRAVRQSAQKLLLNIMYIIG